MSDSSRDHLDSRDDAAGSRWTPDSPAASAGSHATPDSQPAPATRRPGEQVQASALQATCGQCWAYPNRLCKFDGGEELHLLRYERANKKGVVSDEELERARAVAEPGKAPFVIWGKEEIT